MRGFQAMSGTVSMLCELGQRIDMDPWDGSKLKDKLADSCVWIFPSCDG